MDAVLDLTIGTVKRLVRGLRPRMLDEFGLVAAIEAQLADCRDRHIQCRLEAPRRDVEIDKERQISLFRIFQESMTNVMRHAEATQVDVLLDLNEERALLQVQDNGRGIAPGAATGQSLGLVGMEERARRWGGSFEVTGTPGAGTTIRATIPLRDKTAPPVPPEPA
ncbi:hypothetical protein KP001_15530 [Geomonas subterranea]|uniref:Histidine kinase domain-containing protein n=2 Tax=Geomonas subterranea TaxID=2847989 RepID=A0ABX8LM10_9BACT|nr:hypothetical protein KP001_15530 [Geomonas subterranea]QXM11664.1 hypothetical protein KP002_13755 [Geomonas subterranea]